MEAFDYAGVAALFVAIVAIYKAWKGDPKADAEATKTWQEMAALASKRNKDMQEEIDSMCVRLDDIEAELSYYKQGVGKLLAQLESMDVKPVWHPRRRK